MMADDIHRLVRTRTANPDPFREAKAEATRETLALSESDRDQPGRIESVVVDTLELVGPAPKR